MNKCRVNCLMNAVAGFDKTGATARSCYTGDVPGGYTYAVPFSISVGAGLTVAHIVRPMTAHGAIPYAMVIDSAVDRLMEIVSMTGPDRKTIGMQGAQGSDIGTSPPLDGFIDRDILKAGYSSLPPSIGKITPDQGLTINVLNNDSVTNIMAGELFLFVPSDSGDTVSALNECPDPCLENAVRNFYESGGTCRFTGNDFRVGLYPLYFRKVIPAGGATVDLRPALTFEGRVAPVQLKLSDVLPAGLTIDSIDGPDGQPIGLLGDGISTNWNIDPFQDWEQVVADLSNLPPNIGGIYATQGMLLEIGNSTAGDLVFEGELFVYNPPKERSEASGS